MRLKFCAVCGAAESLEQHHFVPRAVGGGDEDSNMLTLCSRCHGRAHNIRRMDIGSLTKMALAWRKVMGIKLGAPNPEVNLKNGARISADLRHSAALVRDRLLLDAAGTGSLSEKAARLNAAGYRSTEGKPITRAIMSRMVRRASQKP